MYAIAFDLEQDTLSKTYGSPTYANAYVDIKQLLTSYGFSRQQGSVYFGDPEKVDAVRCVLAVQELARRYSWFAVSVKDIRMMRIEDNNDLKPAIEMITGLSK
jgi:virulence-associated protein VapD